MGMREEFEAWSADHDYLGGIPLDIQDDKYWDIDLQHAWESWQASRAALVIELPPRDYYNESDNPVDLLDYVTSELTDAGVTIVTITVSGSN